MAKPAGVKWQAGRSSSRCARQLSLGSVGYTPVVSHGTCRGCRSPFKRGVDPVKRRWSADRSTVAQVPDLEQLDELLKRFGTSLHSYRGEGRLCLRSGNDLDVKFVVAQLPDGTNIILFRTTNVAPLFSAMSSDGILRLEGRTSDGHHIETRGKLGPRGFPGDVPREWGSGSWDGNTAQKLRIRMRSGTPGTVRYGLTNVCPPWRRELPLCLRCGDTAIKARLLRVPESRLDL